MPTPSLPSLAEDHLQPQRGFSLIEIAVVLVIVAILITSVGVPLAAQLDQQRRLDTERRLEAVKEALYGYAIANGRLPCPASSTSNGIEAFAVGGNAANGNCSTFFGFVPAGTLGLSGVDASGYLVDGWNDGTTARRIRYSISSANTNALTKTDGVKGATMTTVAATNQLYICPTGLTSGPPTTNCGALTPLTQYAPFVVFSLGKDSTAALTSYDALNNQTDDVSFSSGTETANFDDLVTWGSLNTLFARMVQAGKLP